MPPTAVEVLGHVVEGERALKDLLHQLSVVEKALAVKWLASASGYTESSTYKALDRDAINSLPCRTIDAAALGSREIAGALLRFLSERWAPKSNITTHSLAHTLQELAQAAVAQAHSQGEAYARLADGKVTADDLAALERLWAVEDEEREQGRDAIRAMNTERIYGLPNFGRAPA